MKKTVLALIAALSLSSSVFAQQSGSKLLVVMRDGLDNRMNFGFAVWHIVQLKRGGVDVRVIFEGESMLNLLGETAVKKYSEMRNPVSPQPAVSTAAVNGALVDTSSGSARPVVPTAFYQDPAVKARKYQFGEKKLTDSDQLASLVADLKREVPYEVCSLSAAMMDLAGELRASGLSVSADATRPVDLSKYVKDGYQIVVW